MKDWLILVWWLSFQKCIFQKQVQQLGSLKQHSMKTHSLLWHSLWRSSRQNHSLQWLDLQWHGLWLCSLANLHRQYHATLTSSFGFFIGPVMLIHLNFTSCWAGNVMSSMSIFVEPVAIHPPWALTSLLQSVMLNTLIIMTWWLFSGPFSSPEYHVFISSSFPFVYIKQFYFHPFFFSRPSFLSILLVLFFESFLMPPCLSVPHTMLPSGSMVITFIDWVMGFLLSFPSLMPFFKPLHATWYPLTSMTSNQLWPWSTSRQLLPRALTHLFLCGCLWLLMVWMMLTLLMPLHNRFTSPRMLYQVKRQKQGNLSVKAPASLLPSPRSSSISLVYDTPFGSNQSHKYWDKLLPFIWRETAVIVTACQMGVV